MRTADLKQILEHPNGLDRDPGDVKLIHRMEGCRGCFQLEVLMAGFGGDSSYDGLQLAERDLVLLGFRKFLSRMEQSIAEDFRNLPTPKMSVIQNLVDCFDSRNKFIGDGRLNLFFIQPPIVRVSLPARRGSFEVPCAHQTIRSAGRSAPVAKSRA